MVSEANGRNENLILIVEDSPTQAAELQYILEIHGYLVESASNGRNALIAMERIRPLTVISDIVMPEMDGFTLCRQIKANSALREIPVILLTALSEPEDVIMGLECGADYFIMKPYNERFLLSRLQHIIANHRLGNGHSPRMGLEIYFRDKKYFINSDRLQILNLLLSTYETAIQKNQELLNATQDLATLNRQLENSLTELDAQNHQLEWLNLELQRQTKAAEDAKYEAIEANRSKSDFLANMSHELRTPLNSVIGFSEVLEDEMFGQLNEKQHSYVGNILASGKHLLGLINDILDLSKVEAGKVELEPARINLHTLLGSALTMLQEKALKHGIRLTLDVAPEEGLELIADERKLKQIMFNLLSNALKFTPEGGSVRVTAQQVHGSWQSCLPDEGWCPEQISASSNGDGSIQYLEYAEPAAAPDGTFIEIAVQDTGIGIRSDDFPKLFQEFSQLSSPYTKEHEGTGLGLALTKRLVELHKGHIWVESELGRGSRFAFVVPVQQEVDRP
jgi:two-component system sensor histidine kinase/response regulator